MNPETIEINDNRIKGKVINYDFSTYCYDWNHFQTTTLQTVEHGPLTLPTRTENGRMQGVSVRFEGYDKCDLSIHAAFS